MRSYNHLMEKLLSPDNIRLAVRKASKGKRDRKRVREILKDTDRHIEHYQNFALFYKHRIKPPRIINDGINMKKREIIVPSFDEQVLHHMVVNVLEPIITKGMYTHVHGSIPKRGPVAGKKRIERWIRNDPKNCKYVLKMDIRHFFGSIPHDNLIRFISDRIHDKAFINILTEIINCTSVGLPLGFHTSHWLANWYLQKLDHYIKQDLGAGYYIRYMDDMVIFGANKKKLHRYRRDIEVYLSRELGLEMKDNRQVFRLEYTDRLGKTRGRDLDFMGYRFHRTHVTIRRSIMYRMTRKARRIGKKDKPTVYDCKQMISALSWLKHSDSYGMYLKHIKPYVNLQYMKRRISRYDRRQNRRQIYELV